MFIEQKTTTFVSSLTQDPMVGNIQKPFFSTKNGKFEEFFVIHSKEFLGVHYTIIQNKFYV